MKRLRILNDNHYDSFMGMVLESVYRYKSNEWYCETKEGFLVVRATAAVISIGYSEIEDNRFDEMCIVGGAVNKKDKLIMSTIYTDPYSNENKEVINFKEIVDFMGWQVDSKDIWDG